MALRRRSRKEIRIPRSRRSIPKNPGARRRNAARHGGSESPKIGASCVNNSKLSLQQRPLSGSSVVRDQTQNSSAAGRLRSRPCHAHQQPHNMPIARNPAAERPRSSCSRRIPKTSCVCCGAIKDAQIREIIPTTKAPALTLAFRGAIVPKCRCKYPVKGSMKNPVNARPLAASQ
jgi:hypothetical protein